MIEIKEAQIGEDETPTAQEVGIEIVERELVDKIGIALQ